MAGTRSPWFAVIGGGFVGHHEGRARLTVVVVDAGNTASEAAAHGELVTDELACVHRTLGPDPADWLLPDDVPPAGPSTPSSVGRAFSSGSCAIGRRRRTRVPRAAAPGVPTAGE